MVVVTYDEFGGQWDHVSPPGQGRRRPARTTSGARARASRPSSIAPDLAGDFVVDHTEHDTTSILATIESRWHLAALGTRDAAVNDLSGVFSARSPH